MAAAGPMDVTWLSGVMSEWVLRYCLIGQGKQSPHFDCASRGKPGAQSSFCGVTASG